MVDSKPLTDGEPAVSRPHMKRCVYCPPEPYRRDEETKPDSGEESASDEWKDLFNL